MTTTKQASVCIQNLGKYNEGELVFKWLDLPATHEEIEQAMTDIGINEEYEEYMIADWEYIKASEFSNVWKLNDKIIEMLDLEEKYGISMELIAEIESDMNTYKDDFDTDSVEDILGQAHIITRHNDAIGDKSTELYVGLYFAEADGTLNLLVENGLDNYFDYFEYGRALLDDFVSYEDDDTIVLTYR